jgi:hypothetical protein
VVPLLRELGAGQCDEGSVVAYCKVLGRLYKTTEQDEVTKLARQVNILADALNLNPKSRQKAGLFLPSDPLGVDSRAGDASDMNSLIT